VKWWFEGVVEKSGEKMVLVGHWMGGFHLRWFLTEIATPEWVSKHVAKAIRICPSLGGVGSAVWGLWTKHAPIGVRWLESEYMPEVVEWVGGIHVHCPN
jgi:hypothetical protein